MHKIQVLTTNSSTIQSIAYEPDTREMDVVFNKGDQRTYHFYGVPPDVFQEFSLADSVGRYYNQHIKGNYVQPGGYEG